VTLEFDMTEGFRVSEPYWSFENLRIRGVCNRHSDCEHAFHVVGRAHHFVARHNDVSDFNAHLKINGDNKSFPDDGLIEANTLSNSSIRDTDNPVTPIDLVAANRWTIRSNSISDFAKSGSDRVSYGAFAKGGGEGNVFERNLVICEHLIKGAPGQRIGISLGGGGSEQEFCRDARCITEQDGSTIRSNLVMSCSDDGIYINRSAISHVEHNTLIDTGGISVRFAESSAELEGNLVDGIIRRRDGATLYTTDNIQTSPSRLYVRSHPVRNLFRTLRTLQWDTAPPRRIAGAKHFPDLCEPERPAAPTYGAFEDFSKCRPR
jgi:parallel beta-helix repeat protein